MDAAPSLFLASVGLLALIGFSAFGAVSLREGERRASRVAFILAPLLSIPFVIAALLPSPVPVVGAAAVMIALLAALIAWFTPIVERPLLGGRPSRRVDERDIMFARGRLVAGSPEYQAYYEMRPENRTGDDHTRVLPGLLSDRAELAEPLAFAAAEACFDLTEAVRNHVDGEVAPHRVERPPEFWTRAIKELAISYGARGVGVTELHPYHVYTHIGRGTGTYGDPVDLDHRWGLAFSVEMDHRGALTPPQRR